MPKKKLAKLMVDGRISVRVCRRESPTNACTAVGEPIFLAPGATGSFSEQLPPGLITGRPRPLYYAVELLDPGGQPTGESDSVATLAGAPLPAVQNLTATLTNGGVLLHWTPASAAEDPPGTVIRLHCVQIVLRTPTTDTAKGNPDHEEHDLWIPGEKQPSEALDENARPGNSYEYTAQRVVRVTVGHQQLELAGQLSAPLDVDAGSDLHP